MDGIYRGPVADGQAIDPAAVSFEMPNERTRTFVKEDELPLHKLRRVVLPFLPVAADIFL